MGKSLVWGTVNQLFPLFVAWLLMMIASSSWLRGQPIPITRPAWCLFFALVVYVLTGTLQYLGLGLASMGLKPPSRTFVIVIRLGLTALVWAVFTKCFFRRASAMQVALTCLLGIGADTLLLTHSYAWLFHRMGLIDGA